MPRLRRTSTAQPGWTRRRSGRGFRYLDEGGGPLPAEAVDRIKTLAIPPAWTDVWICPWPNGHLQAVGTDAAGRRQYLYHEHWRTIRDRQKHDRVLDLAGRLPAARATVAEHLGSSGMPRERVLATAFRLLDVGALRIGGERYAEANRSYGLATLRRDHVDLVRAGVVLRFTGKGGKEHELVISDRDVRTAVRLLLERDDTGDRLLAWHDAGVWREVGSEDVNLYVHEVTALDVTAKDFRTWHGTTLAAAFLSASAASLEDGGSATGARPGRAGRSGRSGGGTGRADRSAAASREEARRRAAAARRRVLAARRKAVVGATKQVAEHLGNTPTVARSSYIDPRLVERFLDGEPLPPPPDGVDDAPDWPALETFERSLRTWLSGDAR